MISRHHAAGFALFGRASLSAFVALTILAVMEPVFCVMGLVLALLASVLSVLQADSEFRQQSEMNAVALLFGWVLAMLGIMAAASVAGPF